MQGKKKDILKGLWKIFLKDVKILSLRIQKIFSFQVIAKEFVDAKVVEAHIVPQKLLLTTLIPTGEVSTVAWQGVKVNVSLQPSGAAEGGVMVR